MKALLFLAAFLVIGPSAHGQGTVFFYNHVTSVNVDAPVFDLGGALRVSGAGFAAQLYAGPTASSLAPVGAPVPFQTGAGAGYWQPTTVVISSVTGGAVAFVQVHAWAVAGGATFEQARTGGGKYGQSNVFSLLTGGETQNGTRPPSFPVDLIGLQSFALVPEPSPLLLLLVGGLSALCWRWCGVGNR